MRHTSCPPSSRPRSRPGSRSRPTTRPEVVALPATRAMPSSRRDRSLPASPAPLASIHDRVAGDWINDQAMQRARAAATPDRGEGERERIACRRDEERRRRPSADADDRRAAHPDRRCARQCSAGDKDPVHRRAGKSRDGANPQGGGFFVVKVNKVTPGNALNSAGADRPGAKRTRPGGRAGLCRSSSSPT